MAYRGPDEKPESVTAIESLNGSAVKIEARNTSNTASSDATLKAQVAGTSAGDAKVDLTVNGTTTWTVGVDNSDSDALKIGPNAAVGTSTAITVTTAGVTTVGSLAATNAALTTPTVASATLTGVLDIPRGSLSVPSISFTGDANTGIYSSAADNIQLVAAGAVGVKADADGGKLLDGAGNEMVSNSGGTTVIASNGTQRFTASSSGVTVATVGIITPVGSAAAPSHTFTGDTNTGIYSSTADNVDISTGGTQRVNISSAGVDVKTVGVITPLGSASAPSHTFTGDSNTGVYSSTADNVDIATGGTQRVNVSSAGLEVKTVGTITPLGSASAPSYTFTGDTNTGVYSPGADSVALTSGGTQRLTVDSSGRALLNGLTSARTGLSGTTLTPQIQAEANAATMSLGLFQNSSGTGAPILVLGKSKGTTTGSHTVVASGDNLGIISFQGADGTDFAEGASITAVVTATPGSNDMPTGLAFATTNDGAGSPTEWMRLHEQGTLSVGTTDKRDAASASSYPAFVAKGSDNAYPLGHFWSTATGRTGQSVYIHTETSSGTGYNDIFISSPGNAKWRVRGDGATFADGAYSGAGADFAEMFEWVDGNPDNEDRAGMSVKLVGHKIALAQEGDELLGVISVNATAIGDSAGNEWSGKFLCDDLGRRLRHPDGSFQINPNYSTETPYVSRDLRKEWDAVGLIGKLRIRTGQPVKATWIKLRDISDAVAEYLIK